MAGHPRLHGERGWDVRDGVFRSISSHINNFLKPKLRETTYRRVELGPKYEQHRLPTT